MKYRKKSGIYVKCGFCQKEIYCGDGFKIPYYKILDKHRIKCFKKIKFIFNLIDKYKIDNYILELKKQLMIKGGKK